MSIEVTGPEKYEFQDLVCVHLVLRLIDSGAIKVFVEPDGGEDALVCYGADKEERKVEVQVKGSMHQVGVDAIAKCLTHFPARSSSGCLLERLLASDDRYVLLVFSGRCRDAASKLVGDLPLALTTLGNRRDGIRVGDAEALLEQIGWQWRHPSSSLDRARRKTCLALSRRVRPKKLRVALERLFLEERATDQSLRSDCERLLSSHYRIPSDKVADSVEALAREVRKVKYQSRAMGQMIDAAPQITRVFRRIGRAKLRPADYVPRGDEAAWITALSRTNSLLLSGRPRCGKSYAALYASGEFQALGYEVKEGYDVDEASRYLLEKSPEDRLFLLDDPLGSLATEPDAFRSFEKLLWLVPRLSSNRKLIVAQSEDQLLEVCGKKKLVECKLGAFAWVDLSVPQTAFLVNAWRKMAAESNVRADIQAAVMPTLLSGESDIELGCLRYLASTSDELPTNPTTETVISHARRNSRNLGLSLAQSDPDMSRLLVALAIGTGPGRPIRMLEVAYLLSEEEHRRVGEMLFGGAITIGGGEFEPETFPSYPTGLRIPAGIKHQIDALERRRFISVNDDALQFQHPFYRAAAQEVLQNPTTQTSELGLQTFDRALFSLSAATASASVRNAEWLGQTLSAENRQALVRMIEDGLSSRFPIVRDLCFEYLVQHLDQMPQSKTSEVGHWITSAVSISLDDVEWHDNQAWIPDHRPFTGLFPKQIGTSELSQVHSDIALLEQLQTGAVPASRIARILDFYSEQPHDLTQTAASAILSYDEALIRARVANLWLSAQRESDQELLGRVFQDKHPNVIVEAYEALLKHWPELTEMRQNELMTALTTGIRRAVVAAALLPQLVVFDRVEYSGENPPWVLFERVMPVVLGALPLGVVFTEARLYSVMKSAMRICRAESIVKICESWISWLEREAPTRYLDQFQISVVDVLVPATRCDPQLRGDLLARLLALPGTSNVLYVISDLVGCWNDLTADERTLISTLLASERADVPWLRAVVLTRNSVPAELQEQVLGNPDALSTSADKLLKHLDPKLLLAAISVQCGRPGHFWNIAHCSDVFDKITRLIELCSSHPAFEIAFEEAVHSMEDSRVSQIIEAAQEDDLEEVFQMMLCVRVEWTGNLLPNSWATLLSRGTQGQRENWFNRMGDAAPACVDDLGQALRWILRKEDREELLERLPNDTETHMLMRRLGKAGAAESSGPIERLRNILEVNRPRLHGTYAIIKETLQMQRIGDKALFDQLEKLRHECRDEMQSIEKRFRTRDDLPEGWIE